MPCYNAELFLARTLDSLFAQSYKDYVLYAVNDGSNDSTADILTEYERKHDNMRVIMHDGMQNRGATISINLAMEQSESEYLAFLDADDIWYKEKLSKQVAVLDAFSDVGLVYTNGRAIDENDRTLYNLFPGQFIEENNVGNILVNCYIRTPSMVMVKRELIKMIGGFNEKYAYAKDHDYWIKLSEVTKFHYCSDLLMGYRLHAGQQSSKRNQWDEGFGVLADACKRYPYSGLIKRKRLAVLHYRLGEYNLGIKAHSTALCHYLFSFLNDPVRACKELIKLREIT